MFMEPLELLPVGRWGELKLKAESYFPKSIAILALLETQEHILKEEIDYGFKIYCPYGNVCNGTVAINLKKNYYEVIILCLNDDTAELERALRTTGLIDWSQPMEVPFAPKHVADVVKKIFNDRNYEIKTCVETHTFYKEKGSPLYDVSLPPDLSFDFLSLDYADLVNSVWPHRYNGSDWYFKMLIKAKMGYGLYKDGQLVAWAFVKEIGAVGHLYTLENHRNKGYGELMIKLLTNRLLTTNRYVYGFCMIKNDKACKLYRRLGLKSILDVEWINTFPDNFFTQALPMIVDCRV